MQETVTLSDGTVVQVADFQYDFTLDTKAEATVADDGKLIIEGYASDFDTDRDHEAFEPGAFDEGLKSFLTSNPILLYHHKSDTALGRVLDGRLDSKGLWVKAEVDEPEPGTVVADYYRKIKNGVIRAFSVGGRFYRRMTANGPRIFKTDLREISVTPLAVNPRTLFSVAGKAFETMDTEPSSENGLNLTELNNRLDAIENVIATAEGKAGEHPDGPKIAALLYHLQEIHTLATNTKQDAESENVKNRAGQIADNVKAHVAALHRLAANVGPLPNTYSTTSYM